jgi:transposase
MAVALRFENGVEPKLYIPLELSGIEIVAVKMDAEGYHITVRSVVNHTRCRNCGCEITHSHGYDHPITVRHLPVLGHPTYITLCPKRFVCPHCSTPERKVTTTQVLSWQVPRGPLTRTYEDHVLLQLVNSTIEDVCRKQHLSYDTVLGALERRISTEVMWEEFTDLEVIGIDEIARRKGHRDFLALITTHTAAGETRLLAVLSDRKKETVKAFLDSIPPHLRCTVRTVCTDMWDGFVNAVRESFGPDPECQVDLVIDRFHVAQHYYKAADNLRKREMKRLKQQLPKAKYREFRGVMWLFRRRWADLQPEEQAHLEQLFQYAPDLKRAYQLREQLTDIFDALLSPEVAAAKLQAWCAVVRDSGLTCFNKFLTTLHNWWDEILNYFKQRQTSGFVEGFNNKVKVLKRRCYGILNATHFFQRLYLDLEWYRLFA